MVVLPTFLLTVATFALELPRLRALFGDVTIFTTVEATTCRLLGFGTFSCKVTFLIAVTALVAAITIRGIVTSSIESASFTVGEIIGEAALSSATIIPLCSIRTAVPRGISCMTPSQLSFKQEAWQLIKGEPHRQKPFPQAKCLIVCNKDLWICFVCVSTSGSFAAGDRNQG
jgi:hypothetical protein